MFYMLECWSGYYCEKKGGFPDKLSAPVLRALLGAKIFNLSKLSEYTEADVLNLHDMESGSIPTLKRKGFTFKK